MNNNVRVKICGLRQKEDVVVAMSLNVWALGFIFYDQSPRFVDPMVVGGFNGENSEGSPLKVGVFVNPSLNFVVETVGASKISAVQLHGDETPEFCKLLKNKLPLLKIIKAARPRSIKEVNDLERFNECDYLLIDTYSETLRGGTGLTSRWDLAQHLTRSKVSVPPLILSGGLNEDNVDSALEVVKPWALDVSSSLESSPGVKSHEKMQNFMKRGAK